LLFATFTRLRILTLVVKQVLHIPSQTSLFRSWFDFELTANDVVEVVRSFMTILWLYFIFVSNIFSRTGLLAKFLMKWFDARQLIMGGGLLSGIGLVVGSISTHVAVLVIALVFAGW